MHHPSRDAAVAEVQAGATRTSVAAKYRIGRTTLREWLDEAGVPASRPGPKPRRYGEREQEVIRTYVGGASILDTAKEHGLTRSAVHRIIVDAGVNRPRSNAPVVTPTDDRWGEVGLTGGRWVRKGLIKVWTGERPVDEPDTGYRHECADCGDGLILAKAWAAMDAAARERARAERKTRRGSRDLCHTCYVRRRREGVAA